MKFTDRVKIATNILTGTQKNSMGDNLLATDFLRHGNRKPLVQDAAKLIMSERDHYSGYGYAAINNRANGVVQLANNNIITNASDALTEAAKDKGDAVSHPYLNIIDTSPTFSNSAFWFSISTYLDLKSWFPLMVIRNVQGDRYGDVQEFQLLNPFFVQRVINNETGLIGGYVEIRSTDGAQRIIDPTMIIDIHTLNPFNWLEEYSMAEATKGSQFTLKQADDFTRQALRNNQAAPGIISTNMNLSTEEFQNFVNRIRNQEKGEPLWGNGAGAISWDPMQINMDQAGLTDINEISLSSLIAVTGNSKTMFGIEQSGVTRDTADVQQELFTSNHVIPQLQLIVDALNQDYKNNYATDYKTNQYNMTIDSPLGVDKATEIQDINLRQLTWNLYTSMLADGYDRNDAAKYADGTIDLEDVGEPEEPEEPDPIEPTEPVVDPDNPDSPPNDGSEPIEPDNNSFNYISAKQNNALDMKSASNLANQQSSLQNAIVAIDNKIVADVIKNIMTAKNAYNDQSDIINQNQKSSYQNDLKVALAAFYTVVMPLYGSNVMSRRLQEFNLQGAFTLTPQVKDYIEANAGKAAESHIETILDEVLKAAQTAALAGHTQTQIISSIKQQFTGSISANRAKTIARTEANRAFTMSQYEADQQFVQQNDLQGQAYKQWVTRSANPCPICLDLASQPPIPLTQDFASLGDTLTGTSTVDGKTKVTTMSIDYEDVEAGTVHPNCSCTYQLVIQ